MPVSRLETHHGDACLPAACPPFSAFGSQLLSIHTLTNFVPVSPLESTLTKTSRKSIKTRDFKSFRIRSYTTPLRNPLIKKHLHIHGGRGEGVHLLSTLNCRLSTMNCALPGHGHERFMRVPTRRDGPRNTGHDGTRLVAPEFRVSNFAFRSTSSRTLSVSAMPQYNEHAPRPKETTPW